MVDLFKPLVLNHALNLTIFSLTVYSTSKLNSKHELTACRVKIRCENSSFSANQYNKYVFTLNLIERNFCHRSGANFHRFMVI